MLRGGRAVTTREARSPSFPGIQRGNHYQNQVPSVAQEEEEEEEEEEETIKTPRKPPHPGGIMKALRNDIHGVYPR
ncbi:MAG: hypothetical protein AB7M93_30560 [Candidatus Obscuribacterales bacterium]